MFRKSIILFLTLALAIKIHADLADDAESALDQLRQVAINGLNTATLVSNNQSRLIDVTALDVKSSSLKEIQRRRDALVAQTNLIRKREQKKGIDANECLGPIEKKLQSLDDDLASCVDDVVATSVNFILNYRVSIIETVTSRLLEYEKNIVYCGKADDECLDNVIDGIQADLDDLPVQIETLVAVGNETVVTLYNAIEDCENQSASAVELIKRFIVYNVVSCIIEL